MSELMEAARSASHTPEANAKRAASRAKTMAAKKRAAKKAAKKEKPHDIPLSALRHLAPKKKGVKSKKQQAKHKVTANFAFAKEKLTEKDVSAILAAVTKMVPKS